MRSLRWLVPALVLTALACAPPASAIVAGSQVPITDHPYQARVVVTAAGGPYSCGGVIVGDRRIVTAAHCVYIDDALATPSEVAVGYGNANYRSLVRATVSEVTIPRAYLGDGSYDVALLELATPLTFSPSVNSIPLASASALATGVGAEANAFATGWGRIREGVNDPQSLLRGVTLPLRADTICGAFYASEYVDARSVCAGGRQPGPNAPDTCQGDSGGPLAIGSPSSYELVGLTSGGLGCGRPFTPAIYTETSSEPIRAVIEGTAPASDTFRGSGRALPPSGGTGSGAPPVTIPPSQAPEPPSPGVIALRDTTRPTARLARLSCTRKRRCSFRISTADVGGTVRKLSATATRRVRVCARRGELRHCRTVDRKTTLKPKRIAGGFSFSATLARASYKLTAVATDTAGNRSATLKKAFRVR